MAAAPNLDSPLRARRFYAQRFHALGDEIRLGIADLLRGGERCVCELTAHLGLAQSRLSFHLKVLKDAGLISHRRQGRWSYYALDPEAFREIEAFLGRSRVSPAAGPCCAADPESEPEAEAEAWTLPSAAGATDATDAAGAAAAAAVGWVRHIGRGPGRKEQR